LLVTSLLIGTVAALRIPNRTAELPFFWLSLLIDFVFALWIAWHMPTVRVVGLALVGAVIGFVTEGTAQWPVDHNTALWVYRDGPTILSGVLIYALTAIAVFGLAYVINRVLSHVAFFKSTGYANSLIVTFTLLAMFLLAAHEPEYLRRIAARPLALVHYLVLFFLAVSLAYTMRLGLVIGVVCSAILASLVGQYTGGTLAHIWTFLPDVTPRPDFPPNYLIFGLWPIEGLVEFGASAMVADGLIWLFKVRKRQRIEDGLAPEEPSADTYFHVPYVSSAEKLKIDYFDWSGGDFTSRLMRYTKRTFAKTLARSPEKGELITAVLGLAFLTLLAYEKFVWFRWWNAVGVAAVFGLALWISPKAFWKRTAGFAFFGIIAGYALFAGSLLALGTDDFHWWGRLFFGPYLFLAFLVVYGVIHLFTRALTDTLERTKQNSDQGEPRASVATSAIVLSLIVLAIVVIRPDLLAGASNPAWFAFLIVVLFAFCFWWYLPPLTDTHRWLHFLLPLAAAVPAVALLILPLQDAAPDPRLIPWAPAGSLGWALLLQAIAFVLAYWFAGLASANHAAEPLVKGMRLTYRRKKRDPLPVVFHTASHPQGARHEKADGALHSFPPKHSGVNVTFANDPGLFANELTVQAAVTAALNGLVGHWRAASGTEVDNVKAAVAGKRVFIKPNIVVPCGSPYTTSAEIVEAVAKYCLAAGATDVRIGEIAISNITSRMSLRATGLEDYWKAVDPRIGVVLLDEIPQERVLLADHATNDPMGVVFTDFYMPEAMLEPDTFYIDLPKMKTHLQSTVTLAIKNSHGLVAECERGRTHQRIAQKVVDITKVWNPDLTIIDGYDALEGIGPWPGELVPLRAVIASNDVALADLVAAQLMQKELIVPNYAAPIDFATKLVKATWLAHEQKLGNADQNAATLTLGPGRGPVAIGAWTAYLAAKSRPFADPEWQDEGLIRNIGARFGKYPDFRKPTPPGAVPNDFWREYLPLDAPSALEPKTPLQEPVSNWGPAKLVADEWRNPHVGASVMFSGVFGLMKWLMERYFPNELHMLDGFAIVYGPLRKPLECEGAILFGDGAIATEYMVFAPRIYPLGGFGKPPNCYSDVFERLSQELGGKVLGFATEAITFSRGWYW
jgi:uncharacterized protein (DUF362 family)